MIYLYVGITSKCKVFADGTSLFLKVQDINKSANELNCDLEKVSNWAYQWKMQFNPDPNKQTNEVIFSQKSNSKSFLDLPVKFSENDITKCPHPPRSAFLTTYKSLSGTSRI